MAHLQTRPPLRPRVSNRLRIAVMAILLCAMAVAGWFLTSTDAGRQILQDQEAIGLRARGWVDAQPVVALVLYLGAYLICGLLLLPIWWLQILSGFAFGLTWGCIYTLGAAGMVAMITMLFSRWLVGERVRVRVQDRIERVQRLEQMLGHNGLLVVMAIRLMYFLPFGISNYLLGLTRIRASEVLVGSILGGFPALTIYVTLGADHGLLLTWRYWLILGSINLALVSPLVLRYLWPRWIRKMSIE